MLLVWRLVAWMLPGPVLVASCMDWSISGASPEYCAAWREGLRVNCFVGRWDDRRCRVEASRKGGSFLLAVAVASGADVYECLYGSGILWSVKRKIYKRDKANNYGNH